MPSPDSWSAIRFSTLTGTPTVDAVISGMQWASARLSYSFPAIESSWSADPISGYGPISAGGEPWDEGFLPLIESERAAVRTAFAAWAAVAAFEFTEVIESESEVGDLRFAYVSDTVADGAQAYAYYPDEAAYAGDIWFNADSSSAGLEWLSGSYEYLTVVHEIGHALGLKHPFDVEPRNATQLASNLDTRAFTVMSYSASPGKEATLFSYEPTTPMVLDVAAVQAMYGANTTHNAGPTTYRFAAATRYHQTLWDAGGVDTLVAVGAVAVSIDLHDGLAGSRLGAPVHVLDAFGRPARAVDNIYIALGVVIENATGGGGADRLVGNAVANRLNGGLGNDTLNGSGGNDTLSGGPGSDTLAGGIGDDLYVVDAGDTVRESAGQGRDSVRASIDWMLDEHFEVLELSGAGALSGSGNARANGLVGGAGPNLLLGLAGADQLSGRGGSDTLEGGPGRDTLSGGTGDDVFRFATPLESGGIDLLGDFTGGEDRLELDRAVFAALPAGPGLSASQFLAGAGRRSAADADDRLIHDTDTGALYYDPDGSGELPALRFATLAGAPTDLDAGDFLIVG